MVQVDGKTRRKNGQICPDLVRSRLARRKGDADFSMTDLPRSRRSRDRSRSRGGEKSREDCRR